MKLEQKTILITGGTSGIGQAFARQLLERGNTVIVTGRNCKKARSLPRACPEIHTFRSEAADPAAMEVLYQDVLARLPALDTLINNAGMMRI